MISRLFKISSSKFNKTSLKPVFILYMNFNRLYSWYIYQIKITLRCRRSYTQRCMPRRPPKIIRLGGREGVGSAFFERMRPPFRNGFQSLNPTCYRLSKPLLAREWGGGDYNCPCSRIILKMLGMYRRSFQDLPNEFTYF